ncbi:MAG: DNA polymerase III subunit chi [Holosporales bacterium]|jgi:DNA polymerase IIIc chi subunit|nr:DNA polymerase III subunit chi [Holosporales bacterium]
MSEKSVTFYVVESEFWPVAYRAIEKMYAIGENALFLCDSDEEIGFYNAKLWTFSRLAFIPSGNKMTLPCEDAPFCHTWFATEIVYFNNPICLLHNGLDAVRSNDISKFHRVIDIFGPSAMQAANGRAEFYKRSGFHTQKVWIRKCNSWESGKLS